MTCKKQKNRKKTRHISTLFVLLLMTIFIDPIHGGCFPYTPKGKMLMICWQNETKTETELEGTWTQHTSIHSGIYETYVFSGNKYEYIYINQDLTNCEPDPNWDECNPEEWTEPGEFVIGESCISPLQESASKIYFHKNSNSGPIVKVRSYYIDEGMDNALIFGDENCSNFSYGADGAGFQKQ